MNVSEAVPGVATPLGWSVWGPALDGGVRGTFAAFGVLTSHEAAGPHGEHDRLISIFYGRAALRADFMLEMGERLPGTSGADVATSLFDAVPPGYVARPARRYYPRAAVRIPWNMLRSPRMIRAIRADTEPWWRSQTAAIPTASGETARVTFCAAVDRFVHIMYLHSLVTFAIVQPSHDQLAALIDAAGSGTGLLSGGADHEETSLVQDLWACSRGQLELSEFVARHGFHGPNEGDITGRVWREDSAPLVRMLQSYSALEADDSPSVREARFEAERQREETALLNSLSGLRKVKARALLRYARRGVALRGVGKVAFLQSLDVARASARRLGATLHAEGVFADPDDVFFHTVEEIRAGRWQDQETVTDRRRERERYLQLAELPVHWTGMPDEVAAAGPSELVETLDGVGASAGVVEGRVRVVSDPGDIALEPGEILVARTTDPSWAAIMYLSEGLVMDVGGMLSHAAIVARELGVPCVANTKVGTQVLRTGDLIRVDGGAGRVEVLERVGEHITVAD
ncbi:phosphoenolpyruvate-utilizing protein [Mycobacterium sp. SMC-8]|uniref:PEP-utilizing enzyme n=1 Tax=Mycobacterium sp. SMC-8 TaxID=2857060 RepID=UPI0021B375A5|nr:PEP-utilizing enzyme [Mycobacterium sp. SMC-8]UXA11487.1 phosphoenolpyruvate-utilizing protein [Mycobacterium sp. SMC-8]